MSNGAYPDSKLMARESGGLVGDLSVQIAQAEAYLGELRRLQAAQLASEVPPTTLDLYDWQREALQAWHRSGDRGVVEAVTGTGKTRLGLAAIADARVAGHRAVVLVPTLVLQAQWVESIKDLWSLTRFPGQFQCGHHAASWVVAARVSNSCGDR